jgi:hypothetical protein
MLMLAIDINDRIGFLSVIPGTQLSPVEKRLSKGAHKSSGRGKDKNP